MFCQKCGASQDDRARFCKECGAELIQVQPNQTPQAEAIPVQELQNDPSYVQQSQNTKPVEPVKPTPQYSQTEQQAPKSNTSLDKPLSVGQYIGMFLLSYVPIVGIVFIFIWAFGDNVNTNRKNFSRAILIVALIMIVLSIVISIASWSLIMSLMQLEYTY